MFQVFEMAIRDLKYKASGDKLTGTMALEGALSPALAKELGGEELYRKNDGLVEFTDHGFDHDIEAARVGFFPMPGTPAENNALLHVQSCSLKNFAATKLDGAGAKLRFTLSTDLSALTLAEFMHEVRGWSGRMDIEPLQQNLEDGEAPSDLPAQPKKRGRGGQAPKPSEESQNAEAIHAVQTGKADVKSTKSGKARLVPRKPGTSKGKSRK